MKTKAVIATLAFVVLGGVIFLGFRNRSPESYKTFQSPDGEYKIVIYRIPKHLAIMPGQSSDVPGIVRLYSRSGRILQEQKLEMVSLVDDVEWSTDSVRIRPVAVWTLPKN